MYEMPIFRFNQNEIKRILRISVICTTPMSAISPTPAPFNWWWVWIGIKTCCRIAASCELRAALPLAGCYAVIDAEQRNEQIKPRKHTIQSWLHLLWMSSVASSRSGLPRIRWIESKVYFCMYVSKEQAATNNGSAGFSVDGGNLAPFHSPS